MSRIGDASEADYRDRAELVAAIEAGRGWIPNIFRTMLHSPSATEGWVTLANAVRLATTLDDRTRELAILLVAHLDESRYEWEHHRRVALGVGISESEIEWLAAWPTGGWDGLDRAVLTFVAATATRVDVPQWCLDEIGTARSNRFLVDLAVATCYYVAVAHFAAAFEIEPESSARAN